MDTNKRLYFDFVTSNYLPLLIIIATTIVSFYIFHSNYLWYDESLQFFLSRGIDQFSELFTLPGDIVQVVDKNIKYNMDPGGFSILLHIWQKLSLNILWIRLLPAIFFLLFIFYFGKIFYQLFNNVKFSLYISLIPFFLPNLAPLIVLLRAYSMEALGVILSVSFLIKLQKNISIKNLLVYSMILSILISSRYSLLLLVFIQANFVIYEILMKKSKFKNKVYQLFAYSSPLFFSVTLIYIFTLNHQNPDLDHGQGYMPFLANDPLIFFRGINLIYSMILIFISFFYYTMKTKINKSFRVLLLFTLVSNLFFILLSLINIHPWSLHAPTRLNVCFIPTLISFISIIYCMTKDYLSFIFSGKLSSYFPSLAIFTILIYFLLLNNKMEFNWRRNNLVSEFNKMIKDNSLDFHNNTFLVEPSTYVNLKYLIEADVIENTNNLTSNYFKNIHLNMNNEMNINIIGHKYYISEREIKSELLANKSVYSIKKYPGYKNLYKIID